MTKHTRFIIERKTPLQHWEVVAYPSNDVDKAKILLDEMREDEVKKKYGQQLRLVRETRECFDA